MLQLDLEFDIGVEVSVCETGVTGIRFWIVFALFGP